MKKYIMPVARVLTSTAVLATAVVRQLSPEGSPLTLAIFFSAAVTWMQGALEFRTRWNEPAVQRMPEPLREVRVIQPVALVREAGTVWQDKVAPGRAVSREVV